MSPDTEKADLALNRAATKGGLAVRATFRRRSTPELIRHKKRLLAAVQLRMAGMSYSAIGEQIKAQGLGECGTTTAFNLVKEAMAIFDTELAQSREQLRNMENARLDRLQAAWWADAIGGMVDGKKVEKSVDGARIVMKAIEQRAKLNGLIVDPIPGGGTTNVNIFVAASERARSVLSRLSGALRDTGAAGLVEHSEAEPNHS